MEIDRGLKIRIVISVVLVVVILMVFIERLSDRQVVVDYREAAAAAGKRIIEACDDPHCAASQEREPADSPQEPEEGVLLKQPAPSSGH